MIIFNDLITGAELFSDSYPMEEICDGMMYKVQGKLLSRKLNMDVNIGANPSQEEGGDEGGTSDDAVESGIDIVVAHRLVETQYDKKSFLVYIKDYCKKLLKKLEETKPERAAEFKEKMPEAVKAIMKDFKEYQFFMGEDMDPECGPVLVKWEDEVPSMYVFKEGVVGTKY